MKEVHFCNRTGECSLVRDVYEVNGLYVADVPNLLLQDNWDIKVYGFDSSYTKHSTVFNVVARTRPESYVYTETEQLRWEQLEERINDIEENVADVVHDYLEENPVEVDLTGMATEQYVNDAIDNIEMPDNALIIPFTDVTNEEVVEELKSIYSNGLKRPIYLVRRPVIGYKASTSGDVKILELYTMDAANTLINYKAEYRDTSTVLSFGAYRLTHASEAYVNEAISTIELTPGPAGKDGEDYVLTEADKQEIAGMVEVTGGSSESIEEVYVGTDTPTNENIKIWVNPDEEVKYATEDYVDEAIANIDIPESSGGSVAVDGTTIIQNDDGSISTAIGGSKIVDQEAVDVITYEDATGVTCLEGKTRIVFKDRYDFSLENPLTSWDKNLIYNIYIEYRKVSTGTTGSSSATLRYASVTSWTVEGNLQFNDETIKTLNWYDYQGLYLDSTSCVYQDDYLTKVIITKPATYAYQTIDSNYLRIGNGLLVDVDGKLNNGIVGLSMVNDDPNLLSNTTNTCGKATSSYGAAIGYNNKLSSSGRGICLIGSDNKTYASNTNNYAVSVGRANYNYDGHSTLCAGNNNTTYASYSSAFGYYLETGSEGQTVYGRYNIKDTASAYNIIIGNGTSTSARANGLTINASGDVAIQGTVSSAGADYAEYFEWIDGNPGAEDRVGLIVVLDGNKIRLAQADDEDILGIVSGTATVLGDDAEWTWQGKYLRDKFGRMIMEEHEVVDEVDGSIYKYIAPKINPEFDENKEYISRAKRAEWDAIGMMGKLYVKDDGTCVVNGYAVPGADGVATLATGKSNMRVMERISDNIVRVLLK